MLPGRIAMWRWGGCRDLLEPGNRFSLSEKLHKVEVPLVPRSECNATFTEIEIADDMVCAGGVGKDICSGGAPLFVEGKLAGLSSWGLGCGREHPGVYANVAHVQDWIEESLEKIKEEEEETDASKECCVTVFGADRPAGCKKC
ncbi:hypothetical protein BSKO_09079 [Bryopsis sp. KO-2023]|nr:hypothetical protein BSKO_09079 [Bryopsis sp. KO-2023]